MQEDRRKTRDSTLYDSSSRWRENSAARLKSKSPVTTSTSDDSRQSAASKTGRDTDPTRRIFPRRHGAWHKARNLLATQSPAELPPTTRRGAACFQNRFQPREPQLPPSVTSATR